MTASKAIQGLQSLLPIGAEVYSNPGQYLSLALTETGYASFGKLMLQLILRATHFMRSGKVYIIVL